ncbi:MAG: hypothetical protein AAFN07_16700 [Pseudomonadota bacterium]
MLSVRSSLGLELVVCALLHAMGSVASADEAGETAHADFGKAFATAINERDRGALGELFDVREFASIVADDLFDDEDAKRGYLRGMLSHGRTKFISRLFHGWLSQELTAKYLRTMEGNRPLVRLDFDGGGHEYMLLSLRRKSNKYVAVDLFPMTTGRNLSESIGIATQIMLNPTESLLARLFGNSYKLNPEIVSKLTRVGDLQRGGDFKSAYDLLLSLPEPVRDNRVMVDFAIKLASLIGDTEYQVELTRLEKLYGDEESAGFMLIDYYFTIGEYDKAIRTVDRLEAFLGEDAALSNLRANFALTSQDYERALQFASRATELEQDFEDAYWTLVTVANDRRQYDKVVETLQQIEALFGYDFVADDFNDDFYSEFYQSDAMKAWLQ